MSYTVMRGVFFLLKETKLRKEGCCRRAAVVKQQLQPGGLLECGLQDESWRKPVASGALQVGYLPPG